MAPEDSLSRSAQYGTWVRCGHWWWFVRARALGLIPSHTCSPLIALPTPPTSHPRPRLPTRRARHLSLPRAVCPSAPFATPTCPCSGAIPAVLSGCRLRPRLRLPRPLLRNTVHTSLRCIHSGPRAPSTLHPPTTTICPSPIPLALAVAATNEPLQAPRPRCLPAASLHSLHSTCCAVRSPHVNTAALPVHPPGQRPNPDNTQWNCLTKAGSEPRETAGCKTRARRVSLDTRPNTSCYTALRGTLIASSRRASAVAQHLPPPASTSCVTSRLALQPRRCHVFRRRTGQHTSEPAQPETVLATATVLPAAAAAIAAAADTVDTIAQPVRVLAIETTEVRQR